MKIKWANYVWHDADELLNPFIHVYMYMMLVWGLCFTFFPEISGASETFLYQLTVLQAGDHITSIWGIICLIVVVCETIAFNQRTRWLGAGSTMLGFCVWLFAAITYAMGGFWFGLLVGAVPQLFFWAWLFFTVERYHRKHG